MKITTLALALAAVLLDFIAIIAITEFPATPVTRLIGGGGFTAAVLLAAAFMGKLFSSVEDSGVPAD